MGAEFLRLQYKDTTPWIGIAGYAVATGTAVARVAHNEHWVTDVMAGAGVGILSTRVAYWIYPWVQEKIVHKIFKPQKDIALMGLPYCSGKGAGISLAMSF
jgi:membrane-associated phospholipid phosphatase